MLRLAWIEEGKKMINKQNRTYAEVGRKKKGKGWHVALAGGYLDAASFVWCTECVRAVVDAVTDHWPFGRPVSQNTCPATESDIPPLISPSLGAAIIHFLFTCDRCAGPAPRVRCALTCKFKMLWKDKLSIDLYSNEQVGHWPPNTWLEQVLNR